MKLRIDNFLFGALFVHAGILMILNEKGELRGVEISGNQAVVSGSVFIVGGLYVLTRLFYIPSLYESKSYAKRMFFLFCFSAGGVVFFGLFYPTLCPYFALIAPLLIALSAKSMAKTEDGSARDL